MSSRCETSWDNILKFEDNNDKMEHYADMLSLKIALEIKRYLEDNEISNKDLAQKMGTSPAYITQVLRGDKRINMLFLVKVIDALEIDMSFNISASKGNARYELDKALKVFSAGLGAGIMNGWGPPSKLIAAGGYKK